LEKKVSGVNFGLILLGDEGLVPTRLPFASAQVERRVPSKLTFQVMPHLFERVQNLHLFPTLLGFHKIALLFVPDLKIFARSRQALPASPDTAVPRQGELGPQLHVGTNTLQIFKMVNWAHLGEPAK
jgi:hypothetical protein